ILGVYIVFVAKNNTKRYGFFRNWLFFLQRVTGIITLIFIAWHVWQTILQVAISGAEVNYQIMEYSLTSPCFFWFYISSVIAVVFVLANWLWSFCVCWAIAPSPRAQKIVTYATVVVFFVVSYIGIRTIIQFGLGV